MDLLFEECEYLYGSGLAFGGCYYTFVDLKRSFDIHQKRSLEQVSILRDAFHSIKSTEC
jgi:hypothetical protein